MSKVYKIARVVDGQIVEMPSLLYHDKVSALIKLYGAPVDYTVIEAEDWKITEESKNVTHRIDLKTLGMVQTD